MATQGERIAGMEVRLKNLEETVYRMDSKIDDLLALRNKGAGVFWLVSILVGTGLLGFFAQIFTWMKGN